MSADLRARASSGGGPIFVMCTARSGSTLLRVLLDGHPHIACPGETNLPEVLAQILRCDLSIRQPSEEPSRAAIDAAMNVADAIIGSYARTSGKGRWADKSLNTATNVSAILTVFPNAQFVALYRNALDVVASVIEASPWGYNAYGVTAYVASYPGNVPNAVLHYWIDRVEEILAAERANGDRCYRIRYEDLVVKPEATIEGLCSYLGEPWQPAAADFAKILGSARGDSYGDYKVQYTGGVTASSVGRGEVVPRYLLDPTLIERVNTINSELDYDLVERDPSRRVRTQIRSLRACGPHLAASPPSQLPIGLQALEIYMQTRVGARLADATCDYAAVVGVNIVECWIRDYGAMYVLDLEKRTIDVSLDEAPSDEHWLLESESPVFLAIARGELNLGVALRRGLLRFLEPIVGEESTGEPASARFDALLRLFG